MKKILLLAAVVLMATVAHAERSLSALWKHELASTSFVGCKTGEHLIQSWIYMGVHGKDASVKYGLDVKVSTWEKPFTTTYTSKDKKLHEVLTVTLYKMQNPKQMKAVFSNTVFENGKVKLKFSGQTILHRLS